MSESASNAHSATAFKAIIVACTTTHFYYIALHFDEEVEYIWSKKWTVGKALCLLARYLGTSFLLCTTSGVWRFAWNDTRPLDAIETNDGFFESCFYGNLFAGLGPMVILAAEEILMMRVYALYGRNKKLLIFFVLLSVVLLAFNILQLSHLFILLEENLCSGGDCFQKRALSRRGFIAADYHNFDACISGLPMSGIAWAVTSSVELLLFLLVAIKAGNWGRIISMARNSNRHSSQTRNVTVMMAKDSMAYFAIIFSVCVLALAIVFAYEHHFETETLYFIRWEVNAYETIVINIMAILAPKLILNLRAAYYGPPDELATHWTWNVQIPTLPTTGGGSESVCARDQLESLMD